VKICITRRDIPKYLDNKTFPEVTAVKLGLGRRGCEKNSSKGKNLYAVSRYVANLTKTEENIQGRNKAIT
jgi:hypothetical protein